MAFYSQGKEFLNLPEQVQKNIDDISNLTVAVATKQELANAVNDTNLKEKVEAVGSYDLGAVSVTSLTNTGNTTNTGTLDQEGKATFGSNIEVDGSATFNSPESLVFKTGSLDFSEITDFLTAYYSEAFQFKMAGIYISSFEEGSATSQYDFAPTFSNLSKATSIKGFFNSAVLSSTFPVSRILMPDFTSTGTIICDNMLEKADFSSLPSLLFGNGNYRMVELTIFDGKAPKILGVKDGSVAYITRAESMLWRGGESLVEFGAFNMSNCTSTFQMFSSCSSLKSIHATHWQKSFDISASTKFEESDLVEIIGNLDTVTTAQTLTMGSTNLAKLTQDEILVATGRGWTLA